jgi:tellurite resistance protein
MIGTSVNLEGLYINRFGYLPVGLFGAAMGLSGLSAAWRLAHVKYGVTQWVADVIGIVAVCAFIAVSAGYLLKSITATETVKAEFRHPIGGNMFGTLFVSMLLMPIVIAPANLAIARALWSIGAIAIVVFAWVIATRWLVVPQSRTDVTPAWIIPVIGLIDMPLAVPILQLNSLHGVMVLGLAVGLFFATPLFTLIFQRQLFEAPLPDALKPSLLILVAPSAVGFSSYVATTGHSDLFAQSLYMVSMFLLAVLLTHLRHLPACCPFKVSWWAVSFPLAACSIAALRFSLFHPGWVTDGIALALLALATFIIGSLLVRTLTGIARGELREISI